MRFALKQARRIVHVANACLVLKQANAEYSFA